MQIGQRVRRTARNIQIDRQQTIQALGDFGAAAEWAAGQRATAHGDHNFGSRRGLIGLQQGCFHIPGNGACHDDSIGMARRRHKVDAEAGQTAADTWRSCRERPNSFLKCFLACWARDGSSPPVRR